MLTVVLNRPKQKQTLVVYTKVSTDSIYCCIFVFMKPGGRYRRDHRNRLRQIGHRLPRKRKLVDTPMDERPQCKFFKEGKCAKVSLSYI